MYSIKRFSSLTTTENKKDKKSRSKSNASSSRKDIKTGLGVTGAATGVSVLGVLSAMNPNKGLHDEKILNNLMKQAKDKDISVIYGTPSAADLGMKSHMDQFMGNIKDSGLKFEDLPKDVQDAIKNKKKIILKGNDRAEVFAHELGHHQFFDTKVGRALGGKAYMAGTSGKLTGLGLGASFASGVNAARNEKNGTKENVLSKNAAWLVPVVKDAPMLINEGAASTNAIRNLKKMGVKGKDLRKSAGALTLAGSTYLAKTGGEIGLNYISRGLGKKVGKNYYKGENKK